MNDIAWVGGVPLRRRHLLGLGAAAGAGLLLGAGSSVLGAARAGAATAPTIHPTSEWGARAASAPIQLLDQRPTKLFIHHTASANSTDYSLAHGYDLARSIQRYHMDVRGWIDSGQQFTLTRGGYTLEGRHRSLEAVQGGTRHVRGAHCTGQNDLAVGIENEGTYTTVAPRAAHYAALVELSAYICGQYGIRPYQIYGHRDFTRTDCPGDQLYALLSRLRGDVAARLGGDPTPPAWPTLRSGASGEAVRALQYLLRANGAGIVADGAFGPATAAAVSDFQTARAAYVDGVAGRQTWNHLAAQLALGAAGEDVKAVQNQLLANGIDVGAVDGAFGPRTQSGVRAFQQRVGLVSDGVVDPRTLSRLVS